MIKTPLSTAIGGAFWTPGATVINGAKLSFEIVTKKLFANGEQGFWYDPNDMGTMFQDAAGTVPVTAVGQAVGLVLDKSKGLVRGTNLAQTLDNVRILDGGISAGTWDAQTRTMGNVGSTSSNTRPRFIFGFAVSVDAFYEVSIKLTGDLGTLHSIAGLIVQPDGSAYGIIRPTSNTLDIQVITALTPTTSLRIAEFSVRQIFGNHAYQTTSAARPILQDTPRRIDFDAVDDKLITNLPAQLTGCTVIRSVPGVGVQLLTNQTIPAIYEDNTDHCGLIVINRALTPSETSAITAEFNKRAGA